MSDQEEEEFIEEPDHEIFLGFESGAIAICRLSFDMKNEMKYDMVICFIFGYRIHYLIKK